MDKVRRKSRLLPSIQLELLRLFVADVPARTAAELTGVNRNTATRTVKYFIDQGILFPRRLRKGPQKGDVLWAPPRHARILQVLHNPRYAGAFVYGRSRGRSRPGGVVSQIKVEMAMGITLSRFSCARDNLSLK